MNQPKQQKTGFLRICIIMLLVFVLAGCANHTADMDAKEESDSQTQTDEQTGSESQTQADEQTGSEGQGKEESDSQANADEMLIVALEEMQEISEEELAELQYVEKASIEDNDRDKTFYDVYILKGSSNENGYVYGSGHGLTYTASACSSDILSVYRLFDIHVESQVEFSQRDFYDYQDIQVGEIMEKGDDRYQLLTAKKTDAYGQSYEVKKLYYLDFQNEKAGVIWNLEIEETGVDKETKLILNELGRCYGIRLNALEPDGAWLAAEEERKEKAQDVYEPREGDKVLEKVDGYQYLGVTTLTSYVEGQECPIMLPMGWTANVHEREANSSMHGVRVSGSLDGIARGRFMEELEWDLEAMEKRYTEDTDRYRIVRSSEIEPISGYREALQAALVYEEKDTFTEEYAFGVTVFCRIRVDGNYALDCRITLSSAQYDDATNAVIKEVENAYGIDLSAFYNK